MNLMSIGSVFPSACSLSIIDSSLWPVDLMSSSSFSILLIFCLNSALVRERGLKASSKLEKNTFTVWHNVMRILGLHSRLKILRHHWSAARQKIQIMKTTSVVFTAQAHQSNMETNDV